MDKKTCAMNNNHLQGVSCHHDLTKMQMNHRDLTKMLQVTFLCIHSSNVHILHAALV